MEVLIDVQGFKRSLNTFVFKEVAIIGLEEDATPSVFSFQPPYKWEHLLPEYKCSNRWLEAHWHGISWSSGEIPYERLGETLRDSTKEAQTIWVKGLEKKKWLKEILTDKNVYNIEEEGCPAFKKLIDVNEERSCSLHKINAPVCALQNVTAIKRWLLENRRQQEETTVDEVDNTSSSSFNPVMVSSLDEGEEHSPHYSYYSYARVNSYINSMYT